MSEAPSKGERRFAASLGVTPLKGMPLFASGMNVARAILSAAQQSPIAAGEVIVIAQKIVSKAEGRAVRLRDVEPSAEAFSLSEQTGRPAPLMQLILEESIALLRVTPMVIIARHKSGHVLANAGIDASNVEGGADDNVLLWPRDPDASARVIRAELKSALGFAPAVVIADSLGRAWRMGTTGHAIGCAGLLVTDDRRGELDLFGRTLQATLVGVADSAAAMGVLAMGEGAEGVPAAVVRGLDAYLTEADGPGAIAAQRPLKEDLFQ